MTFKTKEFKRIAISCVTIFLVLTFTSLEQKTMPLIENTTTIELNKLDNFKVLNGIPYLDINKYIQDYNETLNQTYWDKVLNRLFGVPVFISFDLEYLPTDEDTIPLSELSCFSYGNVDIGISNHKQKIYEDISVKKGDKLYAVGVLEGVSIWSGKTNSMKANLVVDYIDTISPSEYKRLELEEYIAPITDITSMVQSFREENVNHSYTLLKLEDLVGERVKVTGISESDTFAFYKSEKNMIRYGDYYLSIDTKFGSGELGIGGYYEIVGYLVKPDKIEVLEIQTSSYEDIKENLTEDKIAYYDMLRGDYHLSTVKFKQKYYSELNQKDPLIKDKINILAPKEPLVSYTHKLKDEIIISSEKNTYLDVPDLSVKFEIGLLEKDLTLPMETEIRFYGKLNKDNCILVEFFEVISKDLSSVEEQSTVIYEPIFDKSTISHEGTQYVPFNKNKLANGSKVQKIGDNVYVTKQITNSLSLKKGESTVLTDLDDGISLKIDNIKEDTILHKNMTYKFLGVLNENSTIKVKSIQSGR